MYKYSESEHIGVGVGVDVCMCVCLRVLIDVVLMFLCAARVAILFPVPYGRTVRTQDTYNWPRPRTALDFLNVLTTLLPRDNHHSFQTPPHPLPPSPHNPPLAHFHLKGLGILRA